MLPNAVFHIITEQITTETDFDKICQLIKQYLDFVPVGNCLFQLNACLNFYIYVISGTVFRNDVRRMLKGLFCKLQTRIGSGP